MKDQKIIDRVRKLLAMAEDSSSPHEAAIAATRASKLMQQHNLDSAAVRVKQGINRDDMSQREAGLGYGRIPAWYSQLLIPVAELHDCHVRYVRRNGTGPNAIETAAEFLGVDSDPEVCTYVFDFLCQQMDFLSRRYKHENPDASRADTNDYRLGCAQGIVEVIKQMIAEKNAAEQEVSSGKELVVAKRQLVAQAFNINYGKRRRKTRASTHRQQGYRDGQNVRVRQGVGASAGQQRIS